MPAVKLRPAPKATCLVALLGLGLALGLALATSVPILEAQPAIEWLENPRALGDFQLQAEEGRFTNQSLEGRWTIVLFGFLHCPDVCPTSLSQLAELTRKLKDSPDRTEIAYVFVSVDPARDSLAQVGAYARYFAPAIRGVVGTETELERFARDLGIRFKVSAGDDSYDVAHSVTFSIIDPAGQMRGRFRPGFVMADLLREFRSATHQPTVLTPQRERTVARY